MSLVLRKACQPLLDDAELSNYHVEISQNKNMNIVGECGSLFVTVKGVTFSRLAPTNPEIAYAVELLDAFLAKHTPLLRKVTKLRIEVNAVQTEINNYPWPNSWKIVAPGYVHGTWECRIVHENDSRIKLLVKADKVKTEVASTTDGVLKDVTIPYGMSVNAATKLVKGFQRLLAKRGKLQKQLNRVEQDVNSCAI